MHCKDVSVRDVHIPLTEENIRGLMDSWISYIRTEGLVLRNGRDHAVVMIREKSGNGLFRKVSSYELVSLPGDTVYIEDPGFDVINVPAMAALQTRHPGKTVIIKGMFSHINFIKDIEPFTLDVIDSVPPEPSKLGVLVRTALASGFIEHPIVISERTVQMGDELDNVKTEAVMFPCKVSGLTAGMPVYFLDEFPELAHDVTLIGCHLSERIFTELYRRSVPFLNVCPADRVDDSMKTIIKCCRIKNGHAIDGNTAKVPWGATVPEVVDAINALFG